MYWLFNVKSSSARPLFPYNSAMPSTRDLLNVAIEAAYRGGRRALGYFNGGIHAETKTDRTPVTIADREAEQVVREHIGRHFSGHPVLGEEFGQTGGAGNIRWVVDPIDGTKNFLAGVPLWGTLVAVEVDGKPTVGAIYLPVMDEMIAAGTGLGCTWNGRAARVSNTHSLKDAALLTTSATVARARSDAYDRLISSVRLDRDWGDCYGYALVATGRADIMVDPIVNPWDVAAIMPIITEAGGRFATWAGESTIHGKDAMATNAALYDDVIEVLKNERMR